MASVRVQKPREEVGFEKFSESMYNLIVSTVGQNTPDNEFKNNISNFEKDSKLILQSLETNFKGTISNLPQSLGDVFAKYAQRIVKFVQFRRTYKPDPTALPFLGKRATPEEKLDKIFISECKLNGLLQILANSSFESGGDALEFFTTLSNFFWFSSNMLEELVKESPSLLQILNYRNNQKRLTTTIYELLRKSKKNLPKQGDKENLRTKNADQNSINAEIFAGENDRMETMVNNESSDDINGNENCHGCSTAVAEFACGGCHQRYYCSSVCQTSAWDAVHKYTCSLPHSLHPL
jgi:hypothetical protein